MADNNEEYEFADLDVSPDLMGEDDTLTHANRPISSDTSEKQNVIRNAIIVVVVIILAMLLYKFAGSFFTKKTSSDQPIVPVISQPKIPEVVKPVEPPVVVETPVPVATPTNSELTLVNQKLATMDLNQQNMRSDMNNLNNQLGEINSSITNLNARIATLSQMVTTLSSKLDQQSNQIALMMAAKAKPVKVRKVVKRIIVPSTLYYIQAVIPGRAWLIASNGSTLTVREGTNITGYGIVKLIDPNQGRVVTSSGRVIRFSPQDS